MNKLQSIELVGIKNDLANGYRKFKQGCFVCGAKHHRQGMTFHHLWYLPGEKVYSDFKNPLDYYKQLAPLIRKDPQRFLYVCNIHHQAIERLARWKGKNLARLVKAARMTR